MCVSICFFDEYSLHSVTNTVQAMMSDMNWFFLIKLVKTINSLSETELAVRGYF